jgi:hypothetical protein
VTSSIPAVKAALVSVLTTALPSTQVIYGPSTAVTTTTGRILTVGRAVGIRELDSLAVGTAAERYTVELVCSVDIGAATSQQTADDLALADYATAEQAIREYSGGPDLGLAASGVLNLLPTGDFELAELADENGRHAAVRWSVAVYAQTT